MDTQLQAGEQFDRFVIIKRLGQGGMATVYLAQDVELQRPVVLKIIAPALAQNDQFMARFRQEAQATARLNHAHIVQVYTTGVLRGLDLPYMALQYIEGGSLEERMAAAPLTPIHALTIARQMAEALAVAHAAGIVHRDVKPSNILLRQDETAVLADLGIAVMQQAATRLTQTKDGMPGTPHYMSPEQGSSRTVDGRSDIYSLGIVLYELLARQLPFNAESPWGIIHQHIYEPPPPLEALRPGLSTATYQLVATCLQKEPAARYQTATALAAAINQAVMVESGIAPAVTVATVATAPRPPWQWVLPVLLVVGLLIGGGVYWQRGKTAVSSTPLPILANITPTATPFPTATQPPPTSTALPTFTPAPTFTPVPPTPVPAVTVPVVTTPMTASQNILAYECGTQGSKVIYLYHLESGQEMMLPNQPFNSIVPAFAPDGSEIVYNSKESGYWHLYSSTLDGSNQTQITTGEESNYEAVWSPDNSQLAFVSNRSGNDHIYIINRDGSALRQLTSAGEFNNDPSWSVSNQIIYESNQTGRYNIQLLPVNGGAPVMLIQQGVSSTTPAWSANGQMVAYESRVGEARHLWVAAADGSNPLQVTFEGLLNERPAWAPNGRFLAFHSNYQQPNDNAYDIWTVEIATGTRQRLTQRGNCFNPAWTETRLENTAFAAEP